MLPFDGDSAQRLAATYATPDVVGQRRRTLELLDVRPGERVLDVGTGPGQLLASLADAVGAHGAAHGTDPSPAMAAMARERVGDGAVVHDGGVDGPGSLPDGPFDAVVCTQVMEYVPDVPAALGEFVRVLRPGGRVLVLDTDWDSVVWHVTDRERHRRVMDAWDDHLAHPRLPCTLGPQLRDAGFDDVRVDVIPLLNPVWDRDTFGAGMIGMIAAYVPGHRGVTDDEAQAWLADVTGRDDYFFSLNRYCFRAVLPG